MGSACDRRTCDESFGKPPKSWRLGRMGVLLSTPSTCVLASVFWEYTGPGNRSNRFVKGRPQGGSDSWHGFVVQRGCRAASPARPALPRGGGTRSPMRTRLDPGVSHRPGIAGPAFGIAVQDTEDLRLSWE